MCLRHPTSKPVGPPCVKSHGCEISPTPDYIDNVCVCVNTIRDRRTILSSWQMRQHGIPAMDGVHRSLWVQVMNHSVIATRWSVASLCILFAKSSTYAGTWVFAVDDISVMGPTGGHQYYVQFYRVDGTHSHHTGLICVELVLRGTGNRGRVCHVHGCFMTGFCRADGGVAA